MKDIEKIVEAAVEKASAKSEALINEERRRANYLKASQAGQFKTRAKIYEYYRAYEGLSAEDAGFQTDLECKYRGIGEDGKSHEDPTEPGAIEQIKSEVTGYLVASLKKDPMGTITTIGQMLGGAVSFGAGLLGGKAIAENSESPQEAKPLDLQEAEAPSAPAMSYEELKAAQAQTETETETPNNQE